MEPTFIMMCVWDIPMTVNSVQYNINVMNQPLSRTFRES